MTVTVSAPSMPFPFPSTRGTGFPASFSPPVAGPVSGKRSGGAPLLCSAADVKSSLPSIVSSGLLPSSSLSSPAFYATSGPATSSSSGSSSIAHIPLSLARRQLSSASSEWVSHRLRQQQLVEQLTGAFVSWQRQAVDEYSQIVARCKTEANHAIAALGQHQPASAAKADWRREAKSAGSATRDEHDSRPLPPPIAAEHISTAAVDVQSGAAWSQLQTVQAPVDGESAAIMAEWESANARQQEAAQTVQQMAEDMGLHTSPLDCQPSLHAFHSLLASWLAERSTLAARVQTIKQTQSALQAEKARLTAWKDTIKQQQQQQQGTDSEAGSSAVQLAEEGKQWEAAKQKLASDGARLKEEHAEYERRIAEYKSAEASIKQKWADIAQSATSEPTPPLPTADRLSALLGELQKVQQANKQLADANGQLTAHTATRQHQQERQAQQELQTIANVAGAATPPAAGGESKQNAGAGHIPSQSADMATSLSAAERRIVEQQRQLAELTRQLVVAQPAEKDHKASRATHTANGSHSTTNRGSAATAAESVETIPLPVSTAAPSPSSSCSSCDSLLARCASLQISLSQCAAELSTANSLLSSERERHAAVESEWRQQQSVYSSSIAGASGTAEVEIARHVREASQRQLQLEDLSRLLDETVRKGNRELNETRASQQRMMEEAVSTLERQQANERQQWAQQLEASVAAADEQSAAREAVEERLAEEERRWRETDAQLTEQRAAFEALRAEAAEALQTRDALFAQVASATADIERLHGVIELEKQKAAEADRDRLQMFDRLREEQKRRKEFQFKYEDAKGKVRVYARVRPFTAAEVAARERTLLRPGRNEWTLELNETQRDVLGNISDKWREFAFDHVFHAGLPPDTKGNGSQAEVFEETAAFAELSLQGINCCIFAYGQSGTGKTWTMAGQPPTAENGHSRELLGLKPRMIERVFSLAADMAETHDVSLSCYLVEIYLNALEDLFWKLDTATAMRGKDGKWPEAPELKVRADGGKKKVQIDNVRVRAFSSAADMLDYCDSAERLRRVRKTGLNEASSRSHLVFAIMADCTNRATGKTVRGKLSLVDLAGSERADKTNVDGLSKASRDAMLEEGVAINESLRMLKNVFRILGTAHLPLPKGQKAEIVQYRGNMLTELMQDSLGGNAKTLMFVNVGPAASNISESVDSLSYGDFVKNITNDKATADEDYTEQIRRLKETLQAYKDKYGEMT